MTTIRRLWSRALHRAFGHQWNGWTYYSGCARIDVCESGEMRRCLRFGCAEHQYRNVKWNQIERLSVNLQEVRKRLEAEAQWDAINAEARALHEERQRVSEELRRNLETLKRLLGDGS